MAQENTVQSSLLGRLTLNELDEVWESAPVAIPLFDGVRMPISIFFRRAEDSDTMRVAAEEVLASFLSLGPEARGQADQSAADYARSCLDAWGWDDPDAVWNDEPFTLWNGKQVSLSKAWLHDFEAGKLPAGSVWNMVGKVDEVSVFRDEWVEGGDDKTLYVVVTLNCFFERMHLVFREGKELTRVGFPDGSLTD